MSVNVKKIRPLYTSIVTTMNKYEEDEYNGSLIDSTKTKGTLKEYQKVVAVGDLVKNIQVGDLVCINPSRYAVKKHKEGSLKDGVVTDNPVITYNFNVVELNGVPHLLLSDRDIEFVVEDYDETSIIMPEEKKLIV